MHIDKQRYRTLFNTSKECTPFCMQPPQKKHVRAGLRTENLGVQLLANGAYTAVTCPSQLQPLIQILLQMWKYVNCVCMLAFVMCVREVACTWRGMQMCRCKVMQTGSTEDVRLLFFVFLWLCVCVRERECVCLCVANMEHVPATANMYLLQWLV